MRTEMRDLVFKNLTSQTKKRRIIASSEITEGQGMRSVIRRHFVCVAKEIKNRGVQRPAPYIYVLKMHDTKTQKEKFFCRIKGSVYAATNDKLFLILFMHSLKISVTAAPQELKSNPTNIL